MAKSRTQHNLEQAVVSRITAGASWLARRVPLSVLRRLADNCAWIVMGLFRKRQRLADANIAATFPQMLPRERTRIRRGAVMNICRTMVELLKLPAMSREELANLVRLEELPMIRDLLQTRGVLIVTAHYGNWEWAGARLGDALPLTVIARDAPHDVTASLINEARASHGMRVIGREDLRRMMSVLKNREILAILPDQHALQGGILTDFLGRPAWSFTGPALLAARTGAAVVPFFTVRKPDGTFDCEVGSPLDLQDTGDRDADVIANTQLILDAISEAIRRHPEQWLWLHDRWKMKPASQQDETPSAEAVQ